MSADYKVDHSRPPPGWPLRQSQDVATLLQDLVRLPEPPDDVAHFLLDEMPIIVSDDPACSTTPGQGGGGKSAYQGTFYVGKEEILH